MTQQSFDTDADADECDDGVDGDGDGDDENRHIAQHSLGKLAKREIIWTWIVIVIVVIIIIIIIVNNIVIVIVIIIIAQDSLEKLARKESIEIEYWRFNGSHTSVKMCLFF